MELQCFEVDNDFSFSVAVNNFIEDTDIFIIFRRGASGILLSPETAQNLFKCHPKINKMMKKFQFEGALTYFIHPEESGGITNLILTRKYDRRNGIFRQGCYLEAYKFGAIYKLPVVLPISKQVLVKLSTRWRNLPDIVLHWQSKVDHISDEILNGPKLIFIPQHFPVLLSFTKSVVQACNAGKPLTYSSMSWYVQRFLTHWCKGECFITLM
jgi:hypothetical protein